MMTSVTLKTHTSGDTWHGLDLTVNVDGVPMNLTGATVLMQMRKLPESHLHEWKSTGGHPGIVITNAVAGQIHVEKHILVGQHKLYFDVEVTSSGGDVRTVLSGVLPIEQDVSRA